MNGENHLRRLDEIYDFDISIKPCVSLDEDCLYFVCQNFCAYKHICTCTVLTSLLLLLSVNSLEVPAENCPASGLR